MKTLRMFGMAMVAIVMGVSLASCSKDENPENNGDFSNEKKLVKMVNSSETFTFTYDSEGRLSKATLAEMWNGELMEGEWQLVWGDDAIKIDDCTLTIKNGLVQSSSKGETFAYNSSNRIIKYDSSTAIWDNDKLVSAGDFTLTYGESCKKGYFPLIPFMIGDYYQGSAILYFAHPEIAGMRTKQLPTGMNGRTLSYEFDKDGYITKIDLGGLGYTLTWE